MKNRDRRSQIDPHKHESTEDRTRRHQQAAGLRPSTSRFDYVRWNAMHREAEAATLFNPDRHTPAFLNKGRG